MISEQPIFNTWTGDGVTTVFNHVGRLYIAADLQVFTYNPGVDVVPVKMTSGYTVAVAGDFSGAAVTITPAPAAGVKVGTIRRMDLTQDINISNTDYVPPSIIEQQIDRQVMMNQEAVRFATVGLETDPFDFTATSRALAVSAFDAGGKPTIGPTIAAISAAQANAAAAAASATAAATSASGASGSAASALASYNSTVAAIAALGNPLVFQGAWDASAGTFPGGGTAKAGYEYIVTVAGTVGGVAFALDDVIIATANNASTTVYAANWYRLQSDRVNSVAGLTGAIAAPDLRLATTTSPYCATRTALKALDTTKDAIAHLTEAGREGTFVWRTGNFASLVTADATEGLYLKANAIATTAGAWVRQRRDLSAQLDWFGTVTGANAGANAATNDAAFASAKGLSSVLDIVYGAGIYEHAATLTLDRNHLRISGYAGFPVFGTGGGTNGTIVKWTGASGGVIAQMQDASGNDTSNNRIGELELDGNALAAVGIDVRNTQFACVENCAIRNLKITGTPLGLRTLPLAVAGTGLNCVYRGKFKNLTIQISGSGCGVYVSGVTGIGNTTFCCFEEIHVTHENNGAFYLISGDDNSFLNCAASRVALGNGAGIVFDGTGTAWVVGNTFYMFHAGVTDTTNGPALITATGAKARQNKIYGLSGVDFAPTMNITGGAALQYDFLGTGYTSSTASEVALNHMAEAHLTALRLGSDYTTYSTATRDVNANDKVIYNNPGTGGFEYQIGGVASIDYTLATMTITSFDPSANVGPFLDLFRDSASPAVSDSLGYLSWSGRSSANVKRTYFDMFASILDPIDTTEDAQMSMRGMVNGTLTTFLTLTVSNATFTSGIKSSHATNGIGYSTGAGGTVTQATSKATGVALNKSSGAITLNAAALAADTTASFVLTNTAIAATDVLILNHISGGTPGSYLLNARAAAGSATIDVRNITPGSLSEAIVIQFVVIKGVNA